MSAENTSKVVSARKVQGGNIVYLTSCDAWTPDIEIAEYLAEDDQEWRLAFANRLREVEGATLVNLPAEFLAQAAVA